MSDFYKRLDDDSGHDAVVIGVLAIAVIALAAIFIVFIARRDQ